MKKMLYVITMMIVACVCVGCGKKEFGLNQYLSYEAVGYNGYAKVNVKFDEDALEDEVIRYIEEENEKELDSKLEYELRELLSDSISVSADPNENLSNGSDYTIKWKVDESLEDRVESLCDVAVSFDFSDQEEEVADLKDVSSYDAFENVSVSYEGMNGSGRAYVDSSNAKVPELTYSVDKESELSNGEEITVTIKSEEGDEDLSSSEVLRGSGLMPKEKSKKFKVEGLSSYVTDPAQITGEGLEVLKKDGEAILKSAVIEDVDDCKGVNLTYVGMYVLNSRDSGTTSGEDDYSESDETAEMFTVYKVELKDSNNKQQTYYRFVRYVDVKIDTANTLSYSHYTNPNGYSIDKTKDCYECKRLSGRRFYAYGYENINALKIDQIEALANTYDYKTDIQG